MTQRHKPRRSHVSGRHGSRRRARAIARDREHGWFTTLLSGYDDSGKPSGPYAGVRILDEHERPSANDEDRDPKFAGCCSKGLKHAKRDENGHRLVDPDAAKAFERTLPKVVNETRIDPTIANPISIKRIDRLAINAFAPSKPRPLVDLLAGVATSLDGVEPMDVPIPRAPALESRHAATELLELYWMALLRNVPFRDWQSHGGDAAVTELNAWNQNTHAEEGVWFAEHSTARGGKPSWDRVITPNRLFRGSAPGVDKGGYLSLFLLADVPCGTPDFEPKQYPLRRSTQPARAGLDDYEKPRQPITSLRDLAHFVHFDALHRVYSNAALIMNDLEVPTSFANIYNDVWPVERRDRQTGFGTFGAPHFLVLLSEVATRALKAAWHQKWFVHRRLRPEAMGARLFADITFGSSHLHPELANTGGVRCCMDRFGTPLLPMAFPEGSPMHPSYGAGHGTVAGACVTILKALYDPYHPIREVVVGRRRVMLTDAPTVEGELNKLAANIAIGRNAAGVHYRSDYTKSLALGEAVATAFLQELAMAHVDVNPNMVFSFPTFSGRWIGISAMGEIARCDPPAKAAPMCQPALVN